MSAHPPVALRGPFLTDLATRSAYSEGAGPFRVIPAAVAIPFDRDDLLALVDHARENGVPLIPRGAGSGIPGGNIGPGVIVDLRRFNAPLEVSGTEATVGAAVTWGALDQAAAGRGLRLGPNPSSGAFCTLGGMVATNAAGARTVRSGSVRPWVRGVELVTADGEAGWLRRRTTGGLCDALAALTRFRQDVEPAISRSGELVRTRFPRTRKNSSGYALDHFLQSGDPLDLVVGAEATLGIVTRVELALEPRPQGIATVVLRLDSLGRLPAVVETVLALQPSAVELLDRTFLLIAAPRLPFPVGDIELVLVVEFEAADSGTAKGIADEAVRRVGDAAALIGSGVTESDREALWAIRHAASPVLAALPAQRRSLQIVEDGCVPVAVLDQYLTGIRAAAARHGVEIVAFGHAGDGHLHVNALADTSQPDFDRRLEALLADGMELLVRLGGTPSGEHGDGRLRTPWLERFFGAEILELFRRMKHAFDPLGIMNPGVKVPLHTDGPLMQQLKVGPRAAAIPASIEAGLRRLEQGGLWATAKTELVGG